MKLHVYVEVCIKSSKCFVVMNEIAGLGKKPDPKSSVYADDVMLWVFHGTV